MNCKTILARTFGLVLTGLSPHLHGQFTTSAGTAASMPLDNVQPSLGIRAILMGSGIFPSRGGGLTAYSGNDEYMVGELRYFAGSCEASSSAIFGVRLRGCSQGRITGPIA